MDGARREGAFFGSFDAGSEESAQRRVIRAGLFLTGIATKLLKTLAALSLFGRETDKSKLDQSQF
jgi:hypothetical protein